MAIKCKLGELVNAVRSGALGRLGQMEGLSGKSVYDAHRLLKKARLEMEAFQEATNALIRKHGEGEPPSVKADSPAMRAYLTDLEPLLESEVELDCSPPAIPRRCFEATDKPCGLEPVDLELLEKFAAFPGENGDAKKSEPEEGTDA